MVLRAHCQNERIGQSIGNVLLEPEIFFLLIYIYIYTYFIGRSRIQGGEGGGGGGRKYEKRRGKKEGEKSDLAVNIRGAKGAVEGG